MEFTAKLQKFIQDNCLKIKVSNEDEHPIEYLFLLILIEIFCFIKNILK